MSCVFSFNSSLRGFVLLAKCLANILMWLTIPKKDLTSATFLGVGQLRIASIF